MVRTRIFAGEPSPAGEHALMLNGARGSFGLSLSKDDLSFQDTASWAWSSDVACHVHIRNEQVLVSRWDSERPARYQFDRVSSQLSTFYERVIDREPKYLVSVARLVGDTLRRIRSAEPSGQPERSLAVLLYLLADWRSSALGSGSAYSRMYQIDELADKAVRKLAETFSDHFRNVVGKPRVGAAVEIKTWPSLVLRHATPVVFQQVHMEMASRGEPDLFGARPADLGDRRGTGVHFTPPGIARSVVEQAIQEMDTPLPATLTILDPACGSGAFLIEALRILSDSGYNGRVRVIGYDISQSAVLLARFALGVAKQEWPRGAAQIEIAISQRDALQAPTWDVADLILMNPPFMPLVELDEPMQRTALNWLGNYAVGRPDLSMAFVERAAQSIKPGGTIGSLLPSSILRLKSADRWRRSISERLAICSLASLGEFTLFRDATVDTAFMVLMNQSSNLHSDSTTRLLWCGETQGASSSGLRALRRFGDADRADDERGRWSIRTIPQENLLRRLDWQPWPGRAVDLVEQIDKSVHTNVGDTFDVMQGALPAPREAFILNKHKFETLPAGERQWFRPVLENANIRDGRVGDVENHIFYPNSEWLQRIESERDLKKKLPQFWKHLAPYKDQLQERRGKQERWWNLGEDRRWLRTRSQKIVSAYFGLRDQFAVDHDGEGVVVQGYGWILTGKLTIAGKSAHSRMLDAYLCIFTSELFESLLGAFAPRVQGGQFNLSARYSKRVPLPNGEALLTRTSNAIPVVQELSAMGREIRRRGLSSIDSRRHKYVVERAYGVRSE